MCNPTPMPPQNPPSHVFLHLQIKEGAPILIHHGAASHDASPITLSFAGVIAESKSLFTLALPILLTNLILYARAAMSMLFLGRLGDAQLAGGALAIAFANITGYSVLSGLSLGMEPLCTQAFGAGQPKLLSITLHRAVLFLLSASLPISLLWLHLPRLLLLLHQDPSIADLARTYILFSLPDLLTNSFLHPIKIYLRAQNISRPLTYASLMATLLHVPANLLLVRHLNLGVAGVASAAALSNILCLVFLIVQVWTTDLRRSTWSRPTRECLSGWGPLVTLAGPSCFSVCLEWWWYEIMIVLCGLLVDPTATVASMGILIQTTGLIYNFPSSLGSAVSTRVGHELGAGRPWRARAAATAAIAAAASMGMAAAAFAASMRGQWGRMYTTDDSILRITAAAMPILGLCELGNCPQTVACGVVRGSARPSTAANVNLGAFYLVGTPVAVALGFYYGVGFCGLWIGLLAAQVTCAGLMLYVVGTTDWDQQAKRAQMLTCAGGGCSGGDGVKEPLLGGAAKEEGRAEDLHEPLISVVVASS